MCLATYLDDLPQDTQYNCLFIPKIPLMRSYDLLAMPVARQEAEGKVSLKREARFVVQLFAQDEKTFVIGGGGGVGGISGNEFQGKMRSIALVVLVRGGDVEGRIDH